MLSKKTVIYDFERKTWFYVAGFPTNKGELYLNLAGEIEPNKWNHSIMCQTVKATAHRFLGELFPCDFLAEDQKKEEKKSQEGKIEELEREIQELKLRVQYLEGLRPD